jgi:uncharacterized protein
VLQDKFQWPSHRVQQASRGIRDFAQHITPSGQLGIIKEDPADNHILECTAEAKSDCIVTGDKHLLKLGNVGNIRIMSVADFLAMDQGLER